MFKYSFKDLKESALGSFNTVLFYFILSIGEPMPYLPKITAIVITLIWLYIIWQSFKVHNGEHFFINIAVTWILCSILSVVFGLTTFELIKANPYGSPGTIFMWVGLPMALLFDRMNTTNVMKSYYLK